MMVGKRFLLGLILGVVSTSFSWFSLQAAHAACGSVTCFVVVGSQQQVPQAGLLTFNTIYNYTPMRLPDGTNGVIPAIDQADRRLILDHHREIRTITQTVTFDLNYGITDRLGIQVTIPYLWRTHKHLDGLGEAGPNGNGELVPFRDNGVGDVTFTGKYNILPTLRSMIVTGFGVQVPTGTTTARDDHGGIMESPGQLGRGHVGLIGSLYQTYELIPQRLNQFFYGSYRHTFRNNDGYQFGDEYNLSLGASGVPLASTPWLMLTGQFHWRYMVHDNMNASLWQSAPAGNGGEVDPFEIDPLFANRRVPNTGSTYFAFSPGFQMSLDGIIDSPLTKMSSAYFYAQLPIMRDSNNNLAQGTSYIFGFTRSFQLTQTGS
ncbi:MAG: transporter [Nitrospira sp.]|nr:transporter [Nitrospira sp.]